MAPLLHRFLVTSFLSVSSPTRPETATTTHHSRLQTNIKNKLLTDDGECIFGKKEYWDSMYEGKVSDRSGDRYSWYCGWDEMAPFWKELVPLMPRPENDEEEQHVIPHVLIAGMGNDPTPVYLFDEGYTNMTAFDYSRAGVERAKELFGPRCSVDGVTVLEADACDLHAIETASVDATLDKGTLDAIFITDTSNFRKAVRELTRVTRPEGGIVVCISNVVYESDLLQAFESDMWENIHDGSLAFAPDGEATIDLGADLYSWRRTGKAWTG